MSLRLHSSTAEVHVDVRPSLSRDTRGRAHLCPVLVKTTAISLRQLDFEYRVGAWARLRVDVSNESGLELRTFVDSAAVRRDAVGVESQRYVAFTTKLLAMFGGSDDAARQVVALEHDIHGVTAKSDGRYIQMRLEAVPSLSSALSPRDWIEALSKHNGAKMSVNTLVSFHDGLFDLLNLLLSSGSRTYLYLGYRALGMFGFDAHNPDWPATIDEPPAVWLPPDQRSSHCHQLIWSANPVAFNAALVTRPPLGNARARDIVNQVKDGILKYLADHVGMDRTTFLTAAEKLKRLNVSLPGDLVSLPSTLLRNSSAWRPQRATPFLLNLLALRALPTPSTLSMLGRPAPVAEDATLFFGQQRTAEPLVKLQRNSVGVSLAALTPLLYHDDFPAAVQFAGLGSAFADAALRVVGPEGEFYDQEGRRQSFSWWSEPSRAAFRTVTGCLGAEEGSEKLGQEGLEQLWRAAISVRVSWAIFRDGPDSHGVPFEKDVERLFFVAYCFLLCVSPPRPDRHAVALTSLLFGTHVLMANVYCALLPCARVSQRQLRML
ncbi:hypothetical protein HPB48_007309 [Haemaphysalis longicornis]|uniref:Uncharacterized protein n=1 Tax=Haemaphysalis longicornis TaxID=44386 RepID=A0A9J6GHV1_HAELO|nr:hypothetical protein HPB48_007309 [Haemaphysalis longicornis]